MEYYRRKQECCGLIHWKIHSTDHWAMRLKSKSSKNRGKIWKNGHSKKKLCSLEQRSNVLECNITDATTATLFHLLTSLLHTLLTHLFIVRGEWAHMNHSWELCWVRNGCTQNRTSVRRSLLPLSIQPSWIHRTLECIVPPILNLMLSLVAKNIRCRSYYVEPKGYLCDWQVPAFLEVLSYTGG